jgi:membrane protein YqaA with SNARE-associated domain
MTPDEIYEYNRSHNKWFKRLFYAFTFLGALFVVLSLTTPLGDIVSATPYLGPAVEHVMTEMYTASLLGTLYLGAIAGLFIFTVPLEALFIQGVLNNGYPAYIAILIGVGVSYTINYFAGRYLSNLVQPVIGPKKFYRVKARLNSFGPWFIFIMNLVPMISQSFTAVLGVLKYNPARLAVYTALGQVVKYAVVLVIAQTI